MRCFQGRAAAAAAAAATACLHWWGIFQYLTVQYHEQELAVAVHVLAYVPEV